MANFSSIEKEGHRLVTNFLIGGGEALTYVREDRILSPLNYVNQLVSTNGDGTGATEQVAAAAKYSVRVPSDRIYVLTSLDIIIIFSGQYDASLYGSLTALANGILITVKDSSDTVIANFTPQPVKNSSHWDLVGGSGTRIAFRSSSGNSLLSVDVDFLISGDVPLVLDGSKGHYLEMNVQNSLVGLVSQLASVQGRYYLLSDFSSIGT